MSDEQVVTITYLNYRGNVTKRRVLPFKFHFGTNEWYKEPQWLMLAFDFEKQAMREFALKNVRSWEAGSAQERVSTPSGSMH